MEVIKNSTVASAGLPATLNSQGDVEVPMEASVTLCHCVVCLAVPPAVVKSFLTLDHHCPALLDILDETLLNSWW